MPRQSVRGVDRSAAWRWLPVVGWLLFTALLSWYFSAHANLQPQIDQGFFFSAHDPALKVDNQIDAIFPDPSQIALVATGDLRSADYLERLRELTDALLQVPGVVDVTSLTRGPKSPEEAMKSELWQHVLIANHEQSSFVMVTLSNRAGPAAIHGAEALQARYDRPGFRLVISGMPYVTDMFGRDLERDLRTFSLAAICIFGAVLLLIFRSLWVLLGAFVACADSGAATLLGAQWLHIPIGPLTANLATMVFVMTLSPMVYLTFNWKRAAQRDEERPTRHAVRETITPSVWSSVCMLIGFLSLLLVPSTPMRHLGTAGALGAALSFAGAYGIYPWFLRLAHAARSTHRGKAVAAGVSGFFARPHAIIVAVIVAAGVIGALGLPRLNVDPPLNSYFKPGGAIRKGLDFVDRIGGSSPLKLVVEDTNGQKLDGGDEYQHMTRLQRALERDPDVANVFSLPVVLSEAKRPWYSFLIPTHKEVHALESPKYDEVARQLISPDHRRALVVLWMRESVRHEPRAQLIADAQKTVTEQGFRTVMTGGGFNLLEQMRRLVTSSIISGILILIGIFTAMGLVFSRSVRVAAAMLACLALIAVAVRGWIAWAGMPLDFMTATAANLDLGLGVDAMIYLTLFARREGGPLNSWKPWAGACGHLWRPIASSLLILTCGFGIFLVSNFPPTQRFGLFVIVGSAMAAAAALFLFPWLASHLGGSRRAARA
ncbi:MAG TPA: MMPL family transporter [Terriglobales bacterium]|nr:MMPL family transporter [Terriglobales bacterium]